MKGAHIVLRAAAGLVAPLIVLFALALLAGRQAGAGIGMSAGFAIALPLLLHMLVFGAEAAQRAFPAWLARGLLALGLVLSVAGIAAPRLAYAPQLVEAGLFLATASGAALVLTVMIGRAPTLRDEEW